jgi:hypothetical protein
MTFVEFDGGETVRGKGFKKKTWYSICSNMPFIIIIVICVTLAVGRIIG